MADDWKTPEVEALFEAILRLETIRRDASASSATSARSTSCATWPSAGRSSGCSMPASTTPRSPARTGASTATITRIASWLNHGEGGYRAMLDKLDAASRAGTTPYPVAGDR